MRWKVLIFLLALCAEVSATEYDFHIDFRECKAAVGYLVLSDESLKVLPGEPTFFSCNRESSVIECDFIFKQDPEQHGVKGNHEVYEVLLDLPPLLHFRSENGSEFLAINTTQHAATVTTLVLDQVFLGAKVCSGVYLTDFELQNLLSE
jgi:hypothetical protein